MRCSKFRLGSTASTNEMERRKNAHAVCAEGVECPSDKEAAELDMSRFLVKGLNDVEKYQRSGADQQADVPSADSRRWFRAGRWASVPLKRDAENTCAGRCAAGSVWSLGVHQNAPSKPASMNDDELVRITHFRSSHMCARTR